MPSYDYAAFGNCAYSALPSSFLTSTDNALNWYPDLRAYLEFELTVQLDDQPHWQDEL